MNHDPEQSESQRAQLERERVLQYIVLVYLADHDATQPIGRKAIRERARTLGLGFAGIGWAELARVCRDLEERGLIRWTPESFGLAKDLVGHAEQTDEGRRFADEWLMVRPRPGTP